MFLTTHTSHITHNTSLDLTSAHHLLHTSCEECGFPKIQESCRGSWGPGSWVLGPGSWVLGPGSWVGAVLYYCTLCTYCGLWTVDCECIVDWGPSHACIYTTVKIGSCSITKRLMQIILNYALCIPQTSNSARHHHIQMFYHDPISG